MELSAESICASRGGMLARVEARFISAWRRSRSPLRPALRRAFTSSSVSVWSAAFPRAKSRRVWSVRSAR